MSLGARLICRVFGAHAWERDDRRPGEVLAPRWRCRHCGKVTNKVYDPYEVGQV